MLMKLSSIVLALGMVTASSASAIAEEIDEVGEEAKAPSSDEEAIRLAQGVQGMLLEEKKAGRQWAKISDDIALTHAKAALAAEAETGIEAELLLAMAFFESRYKPNSISRVVCNDNVCERVTGQVYSRRKPTNVRGPYFCGALQVGGGGNTTNWNECWAFIDDVPGTYVEAAQHLLRWEDMKPCKKLRSDRKLKCALLGYRGGNPGIVANGNYPARANRLKNSIKHHTPKPVV